MENNTAALSATLDRMVDHILAYEEIPFLDLVQHVWRKRWDIAAVPVPESTDPLRLALKACVLERMAEVWGLPPKNTATIPPTWCQAVPPVAEHFSVIAPAFMHFWDDETGSPIFAKRNIFAPHEFMYFL